MLPTGNFRAALRCVAITSSLALACAGPTTTSGEPTASSGGTIVAQPGAGAGQRTLVYQGIPQAALAELAIVRTNHTFVDAHPRYRAFARSGLLGVIDFEEGVVRGLVEVPHGISHGRVVSAVTPNGRYALAWNENGYVVWDLEQNSLRVLERSGVVVSPDLPRHRFAIVEREQLRIESFDGRVMVRPVPIELGQERRNELAFGRGGDTLLVLGDRKVELRRSNDLSVVTSHTFAWPELGFLGVFLSPNGTRAAIRVDRGQTRIVEMSNGNELLRTPEAPNNYFDDETAFSSDATLALVVSHFEGEGRGRNRYVARVIDLTEGRVLATRRGTGNPGALALADEVPLEEEDRNSNGTWIHWTWRTDAERPLPALAAARRAADDPTFEFERENGEPFTLSVLRGPIEARTATSWSPFSNAFAWDRGPRLMHVFSSQGVTTLLRNRTELRFTSDGSGIVCTARECADRSARPAATWETDNRPIASADDRFVLRPGRHAIELVRRGNDRTLRISPYARAEAEEGPTCVTLESEGQPGRAACPNGAVLVRAPGNVLTAAMSPAPEADWSEEMRRFFAD